MRSAALWRVVPILAATALSALEAQSFRDLRPRPYPPEASRAFQEAIAAGTRTPTGRPGRAYWQQSAHYRLAARIDPSDWRVTGEARITYRNNSPDTLHAVWFHLRQNLFAPDGLRNRRVPITGGMTLTRVRAGGTDLQAVTADSLPGYQVSATQLRIGLTEPLRPGSEMEFEFGWWHLVAPDGAPRGGQDGEAAFVSYWYPQVAVYQDLGGWQVDPYMGNAEFHMGFGDYDVALTVPHGWLIGSTGVLVNPEEVLSPQVRSRLARAAAGTDVVPIVADGDRGPGTATVRSPDGWLTWRFRADEVRDFAFGMSDLYLWDATTAEVGDLTGDDRAERVLIHTLYRPSRRAWAWDHSATYARHSIEFLSGYLWPYPYPHATAVDGVRSCAGMEYPMITCIGGPRDTLALYSVIVHELAHMWFPMQVASDEQRYSWQDEGLTRFNQAQGMRQFFHGYDREALSRDNYLALAAEGGEVELMRYGDLYPHDSDAFGVASYDKMATNLAMLRGLLGEQRFLKAYREYGARWRGKHPAPWDFFHTFEDVTGEDLWWFWRTWWWETWTLDQAVADVRTERDSTTIVIEDRGLAPMPVRLAVRRLDGSTRRYEIPVEAWLSGARRYELRISALGVSSVEIDPEHLFPDTNRRNNVWSRLSGSAPPGSPP